jgi:hypothetical protein
VESAIAQLTEVGLHSYDHYVKLNWLFVIPEKFTLDLFPRWQERAGRKTVFNRNDAKSP